MVNFSSHDLSNASMSYKIGFLLLKLFSGELNNLGLSCPRQPTQLFATLVITQLSYALPSKIME